MECAGWAEERKGSACGDDELGLCRNPGWDVYGGGGAEKEGLAKGVKLGRSLIRWNTSYTTSSITRGGRDYSVKIGLVRRQGVHVEATKLGIVIALGSTYA